MNAAEPWLPSIGPGLALAVAVVSAAAGLLAAGARPSRYLFLPVFALLATVATVVLVRLGALLSWHLRAIAQGPGGAWLWLVVLVGCGVGIGYSAPRRRPTYRLERGATLLSREESADLLSARRRELGRNTITLAGWPLSAADETKHCKLIGTTGTGKTTAINELLTGALARGDRAIIADPDGGYLRRFYKAERGDRILTPFDQRAFRWDLFGEITEAFHADEVARALIPESDGAAREWAAYARTFLAAVLRQLHVTPRATLEELYRLLLVADMRELALLLDGTPAQPFLEPGNERMFGSLRSVTANAVRGLEYARAQRAPPLAVREWVRTGEGVLFLPYQADQVAALRSLIAAWLRLAIFQTLSLEPVVDPASRRLWFVIDELDALGTIDGLNDALARLRKFGGRCVLGFQSIAQVSSVYGAGPAQTLVENCGTTLILRCSSSEGGGTAKFASRLVGDREVSVEQVTRSAAAAGGGRRSTSRTTQRRTEPALLAAQIEQLPDRSGFLKIASQPEWVPVELRL